MSDETIICRCEDISIKELRDWIDRGYLTFDEIKRVSRVGMGPCQGKTCMDHVMRELAKVRGIRVADLEMPTFRPPTKPVKLSKLAGGEQDD